MSNTQISMQQIEGGRASFAFQEVNQSTTALNNKDKVKLYSSYLKRLPSMIQVNGLGQAIAFYYSKKNKGNEYELIYQSIGKWLQGNPVNMLDTNKELVKAIVELNSEEYRRVTVEVLALLNWMRKFATGMHTEWEDKETGGTQKERDKL